MKFLVTGVNGFVGGCIANYLLANGHQVAGIGRQEKLAGFVNRNCTYIEADISKPLTLFNVDVVIHAAALASDTAKFEALFLSNVKGTQEVLAASNSAKCFIHISTSSVYSFGTKAVGECDAGKYFDHLSGYGQTKYVAEKMVLNDETIPSKYILRPRAIYGINDRLILPRLLKLVKGNKLLLPAHVTQNISLTHIDNFIASIQLCIDHQKNATSIYNVADRESYSLDNAILMLLNKVTNRDLQMLKIPKSFWETMIRLNEILRFNKDLSKFGSDQITNNAVLDINKITRDLKYNPQKSFYTSCSEIAEWLANRGGWKQYLKDYERIADSR